MQAIEQRGGVASPAEARIVQEAGLGKPYDRIDTSLAPPLREEEALTQATGIAVGRAPREEVRMAPRGSALRAPSLALHEGEVAVDPTTLKARGPSKAGAQGITRETHGLLEQVARAYGKRIQLYEGGTLDGFVSGAAPDTIHLNVASSIPHLVVFGHELLHTLKTSSPKIYAQLQTTIETQLKEGALEEFKKDYGQNADLEEVVGDIVGNRMPEETFWAGVFGEMDAPEVSRLGAAIIKAVNKAKKVVASITGFKTDALVKDLDAVKAAVQGAMRQFAKERRIPAMRMAAETMRATRGREENAAHQISNARGVQQEHREGNRGRPAEGPSGGNRVLGEARGAEAGRPAPGARAEEIQARENARREGEGVAFNEAEELAAAEKQLRASPERRREQTLEDFNREFGEDLGATFEMTDEGVRMNASGESAASLEAQSRLTQEKARGQVRLLVERDGTIRPLTGVDAVDTVARGGQLIVQRNVGRNAWTVLSEGPDATKSLRARALAVAAKYDIGERASTRRKLDVAGLARIEKNLTAAERDALTRATAERLVEAFKALPPTDEFAAAAFAGRAKRGWYKESAEAIAQVFGPDGPRFAALLAAMSPQTSVQSNLRNALATWKTWIEDGRPQDREAIVDAMARSVEGEKGRESVLGAWVNNSVRALTSDDPTAAVLSGPKVDSFMRNLVGNVEEVTNDTWMANFALVDQTLFAGGKRLVSGETIRGKTAGYLAMNAKVRAAAARLTELTGETWTPAEVQETVWSWAKTLYEAQIEGRTARDILYDEELTDDMIRSTPDFKGLFHDERYEQILRDAGYGAQLDALRAGTAAEQKPAARGEAEPFASATQAKLLDRAAARLEELKTRGAAAPIRASTRRATQADFTPAELPRLLEKSDWAVLTAEDPGATKQSASANAAAMAELEDDLNAGGYDYESAVGKYGDTQNAFIVTGIDEDAARALGEKYGQESILTRDGLVYSDGRPNTPTTGEVTVYDKAPDDFYTSIPATNAFFQVGLDFEERASPARQTETPAFKRWFGDSKVVDAQGQPLVVYHGTSERFNAFSRAKLGSVSGSSDSKTGFWFTADYARGQDAARDARAVNEASEYWVLNVYLQIQRPLTVDEPLRSFDPADSAKLIRKAKREGHDGVIFNRGEGAGADYVVFRPEQIKSATGNSGVFDPTNPDIRASVQRAPAGWTVAAPGKMDDFIRTIQDKQIDTKRIVAAVRSKITDLSEKWDAYLQEELSHGRIAKRTKDFLDFELRPLLTEMQARGVTLADFETYLHNRHAEERNVQIAKVNPDMPDGGSGIKTAAARAYLAGLPAAQRTAYAALAKRADAVIGETEKMLVSSGLEKQETIDTWNKTYEHYAPLQREEFEEEGGQGTGQGMSVKGGASRRAMGSEKGVANILANIASARERTITRSEKNRVATAMYGLAITAPNKDFWMPFAPDRMKNEAKIQSELVNLGLAPPDAANVMAEPTQRYLDPRSGRVVSRPNPLLRSSPNVLALRVNGEDRFVVFSNSDERATRAVRAMKNLDADQLGRVLSASQMVSRWFASVSTQWNPVFGVVNLMRDTQEALFNLSTTPIADQKVKVLKNTGSALLGIYADIRAHRKGRAPQSPWAQLWEEFQKEGGQTGYRDMFANPKERSEALAKELNKITEGKAKQAGRAIFEWLSDYNEAMENAIRLSTYKAAKDKGLSNQQSASIAKNLTVNFNRKGEVALQAGSLYAFFNAAVQGSARLAETLRGPAGKKIVVGGLLLGVLQAFALSAGGFGDDEPPEFVRDKNLILPLGEGKFLSLPLPLGLFVLPAVGRRVTEWLASGGRDTGKRLTGLLGIFADAFNPIGNAGLSMQTLAPTALDPLAALAENRDFAGRPIAREDISGLKPTPGFTRTKDTASGVSKGLSYLLNRISGGTDYVPGAFSPTPDQIDYLIGQGTGGLGREVLKASTTARAAMTGEENPPHKVPLLGRFYGNATGQASEAAKFYGNVKRINEYAEEIAGRRKHGEGATVMAYIRDNPEARLAHLAETVQSDLQKAKSLKRKLMERDAPPETIKAVEARITQIMGRLNRRVEGLQN
jgi:hypothetical protein